MLDTISPITFPSTTRGANSLFKRSKKASCTDCESAATPGETGVALKARIACSTPCSRDHGMAASQNTNVVKARLLSGHFQLGAVMPTERCRNQVGQFGGRRRAQRSVDRCKKLIVFNRGPNRDDYPPARFQDTSHFTQCAGSVREELQPLLAKHYIKCASRGRERRSWRLDILNRSRPAQRRLRSSDVQHRASYIHGNNSPLGTENRRGASCDSARARRYIDDDLCRNQLRFIEQ